MIMDTKVLDKINRLERTYCRGCLLKEVNRTEGSKSSAHSFCITECSVGIEMKMHGNKL